MSSFGIDRKWLVIAFTAIIITVSIGVYYLVLRPNSMSSPGEVEGFITDELGRNIPDLRVSIIDGSVGFPEIAVNTREDGYYQIGSIPQGTFTLAVYNDQGDVIAQKTFQVESGKTTKMDIILGGFVFYDNYGAVGLFDQGIYVIATEFDPRNLVDTGEYASINDYCEMLRDSVTQNPSTTDLISVIISRGDKPTGGYYIQLKSLVWFESYPVVGLLKANFTDPGENILVTEAETNPLVLVPLGKLSSGLYVIRVHIDSFIMTYDSAGDPVYNPIETLVELVWEIEFEVS